MVQRVRVLLLLMSPWRLLMRRAGSAAGAAGVADRTAAAVRLHDSDATLLQLLLRWAIHVTAPAGRSMLRATRSMAMDGCDAKGRDDERSERRNLLVNGWAGVSAVTEHRET